MHLNITVPARLGAEAHLLSKGVSLDMVGRRLHQLPPAATRDVDRRWPREGLAYELAASAAEQARLRGESRAALLHKLGFDKLIAGNPLAHESTAR